MRSVGPTAGAAPSMAQSANPPSGSRRFGALVVGGIVALATIGGVGLLAMSWATPQTYSCTDEARAAFGAIHRGLAVVPAVERMYPLSWDCDDSGGAALAAAVHVEEATWKRFVAAHCSARPANRVFDGEYRHAYLCAVPGARFRLGVIDRVEKGAGGSPLVRAEPAA